MIPPYHWIKFELKLKKSEVKLRHFCRYVTRESNTIKTLTLRVFGKVSHDTKGAKALLTFTLILSYSEKL